MSNDTQVKPKADPFAYVKGVCKSVKVIFYEIPREIVIGYRTKSIPTYLCLLIGILVSISILVYLDAWIFSLFHKKRLFIPMGRFRDWSGLLSLFCGYYSWGMYRLFQRMMTTSKLNKAFLNAGLETKLKELPQFYSDYPIDELARKLMLRSGGLPISSFMAAKDHLESNLNVNITKIENPNNNREFISIIYSTLPMPDLWILENMQLYKDFSFPIGRSLRGDITANLRDVPHFLIAGESGAGKSTFVRMMLTILLANNEDIEIYYLDFKSGMENQVFAGFNNMHCVDEFSEAAQKMNLVKGILNERMKSFQLAKARNLEMFNKSPHRKGPKLKRIVVVVDEIAQLMQNFKGQASTDRVEINSTLNMIARMGRAVGINLVVGVQKPDAKNLDPTIKANLSGVLCFAVSHFSQSVIVLGNSRGADLNRDYKGRAIWKQGLDFIEVQAPLLTEEEVKDVRNKISRYWKQESYSNKDQPQATLNTEAIPENSQTGSATT